MLRWQAETVIARPIADVFAFVTDMRNDPRWCPTVKAVEQVMGEGPGVDARYFVDAQPFFRVQVQHYRTLAWNPPYSMTWEASAGHTRSGGMYMLTEVGAGTRLVHSHRVELHSARRLLEPLLARSASKVSRRELASLKRYLETGTGSESLE